MFNGADSTKIVHNFSVFWCVVHCSCESARDISKFFYQISYYLELITNALCSTVIENYDL